MRACAGAAFVVLLFFGCCIGPAYADAWNNEWIVPSDAAVRVNANFGHIRVDTGDFTRVKAGIRTTGWSVSKDEVSVTANQLEDRIDLEVKLRSGRKVWQFGRSVVIELTVPRSASLDLHTDYGDITTQGVQGAIRADSNKGAIAVAGGRGSIQLRASEGDINASGLDGTLVAGTIKGSIHAAGRYDGMDVQTGQGDLDVSAQAGSALSSSWRLQTGKGNILLRMPDGLGADLDVTADSGQITIDFPVAASGEMEAGAVRGPMNGGGPGLWIHTVRGNIRIEKR